MASSEHKHLSGYIKSIHKKLREEAKLLGTEEAWRKHCKDEENLEKYAAAMQQLALDYWEKNSTNDPKVISRLLWVYTACTDYFVNIKRYRDKELIILRDCFKITDVGKHQLEKPHLSNKYKLLDVGSCYNPFQQFEIFDVLAIDIAPAKRNVLKCDFLSLNICDKTTVSEHLVIELKKDSFDIVVFSLLLEYLPSPEQRLACCLNAYKLLKPEGILTIVTPDSNHVGSNTKIFKSWRYILAKCGFIRVKYEKLPHLHCMVFRKALFRVVAQRWAEVHKSEGFYDTMFIPQDFNEKPLCKVSEKKKESQDEWSAGTFLENVDCDIF